MRRYNTLYNISGLQTFQMAEWHDDDALLALGIALQPCSAFGVANLVEMGEE